MNWIPSAVSALISVTAVMVVYALNRRHDYYELARSLHEDLTSGQVAGARDALGTLVHGPPQPDLDFAPQKIRHAYFTLLWAFERIQAGRHHMARGSVLGGGKAARRYLDGMIRWHVREWASGLPMVRERLEDLTGESMTDSDSLQAFEELTREFGIRSEAASVSAI
ncbi:hypothetical protein [Spirillospora sp. NPDC047279]|uniref:hypothetical protein n=1 Tax=Spirillospora sp. NPDC047279 TaxID=3155478 RepID=UPI0033F0E6BF